MDKQKKEYEAPQLTVVTFKAEKGYANSLKSFNGIETMIWGSMLWDQNSNQLTENRTFGGDIW